MNGEKICALCGEPAYYDDPLDKHHIFGGPFRKKSERDGLTVPLHHFKCHIFGPEAVHNNAENMQKLHELGERKWLAEHPGSTTDDFIQEYGRNYL